MTDAAAALDALFQRYALPPALPFLPDFRLCRMMRIAQLAERRTAHRQRWIYQRYLQLASAYIAQ